MTSSPTLKAVLFDLDGTLVDTAPDFVDVVNLLRQAQQLPDLPYDTIRRQVSQGGRVLTELAFEIAQDHPDFEDNYQTLLSHYAKQLSQKSSLFPLMDNLLISLEEKNIAWGVVTNKPSLYALPLLRDLKLAARCAAIICPDHVKNRKPDPEGLLLACAQIGCTPNQMIYVGDDKRDVDAGKAAGALRTVAAGFGYIDEGDNPHNWNADFYASTVNDLIHWLSPILE
jgi:N-acetyl-D-muramate 6-phosphate phosphatase